jgi:hypothetical protein
MLAEPIVKIFASLGMIFIIWFELDTIPFTSKLISRFHRKKKEIFISLIGAFWFNWSYPELNEGVLVVLAFLGIFYIGVKYYEKL